MQLMFMGATGTVTGSKYLLKASDKQVLVDCGLFQGYKELRLRNWAELPVNPKEIEAIVITHAHIDHTGYIPLLIKNGFKGKVFTTPGTKALCEILLPDSGFLQEEEARLNNKYHSSKHHTALPLYTEKDAVAALKHFETVDFHEHFKVAKTFKAYFHHAGHIIGAACVEMQHQNTSVLFSGDLGRPHDAIMRAPDDITKVDYLVLESTYGNRLHEHEDVEEKLGSIIRETVKRGGTVIIPSFAVGRAQTILYY
ncbi:MAG: MBL fold metallo-hydrolase, partial [Gammaproteobacteria bacterium]